MKLFKKSKNLELKAKKIEKMEEKEEKEENGESSKKAQTKDRKPRKNRFVACLRAVWRRIAGCVRRRHTSPAREEVPGPSNVHTADCSVNISHEEEEKSWPDSWDDDLEDKKEEIIVSPEVNISHEEEEKSWPDSSEDEEEEEEEKSRPDSSEDEEEEEEEEEEKSRPDSSEDDLDDEEEASEPDNNSCQLVLQQLAELLDSGMACAARAPGPAKIKKVNISCEDVDEEYDVEDQDISDPGIGAQNRRAETPKNEKRGNWETKYRPISFRDDESEGPASAPLSKECFTFHRVVGKGYFGRVFMATDKIRQQSVAIKQMGKARIVRHGHFLEERHVLQISHRCPHLIHGLGSFQTADNIYFVMELATGGNLREFLKKNFPLDLPVIEFIAAEVTCGVQFLHNNGIIHRDLKPENILVTGNGHLKITDFGLSATGVTGTVENWCGGTPGYIAPEVMKYQPHGPWADFFAIGVIVYELVTSICPFPGNDMQEYSDFLQCKPCYPSFLASDTVAFIDSLLHKAPSRRLGVLEDIRAHFFFKSINWEEMEAGRVEPPAILQSFSANRRAAVSIPAVDRIKDEDQAIFLQFGFVSPVWSQQYHPVIFCKEPPK